MSVSDLFGPFSGDFMFLSRRFGYELERKFWLRAWLDLFELLICKCKNACNIWCLISY